MSDLFCLSDAAWNATKPHLPKNQPGARRVDDRRVISGILNVLKVGCRRRDVPAKYGLAKTICNRYHRWAQRRSWHRIFEKMAARSGSAGAFCRYIRVNAHCSTQGSKRGGAWTQAIGTSRGGRTSKIHCLADDCGRPIAFSLTPGNIADIKMAFPLLEVAYPTKRFLADKAYNANSLRDWLNNARIKAAIPSSLARKKPIIWIVVHIGSETSLNASFAGSKIGGALQRDMIALQ